MHYRAIQLTLFDDDYAEAPRRACEAERTALYEVYADRMALNRHFTRAFVSFQGNKRLPFYRWFKYKEAFSSGLVAHFLRGAKKPASSSQVVLDPFAGAGTTLIMASECGWSATGIELLPVAVTAIRARLMADKVSIRSFEYHLRRLRELSLDSVRPDAKHFPHLAITEKAFPPNTEKGILAYMLFLESIKNPEVQYLFRFACLSVLEDVSYTRKDGQYLRWDVRSGRSLRSTFTKGTIMGFRPAIIRKLQLMLADIKTRSARTFARDVGVIEGSCLDVLPTLQDGSFDFVITSPPYCNRYDYTRTYALELAFMGYDEARVKRLRQDLLSATVENKSKRNRLATQYGRRGQGSRYTVALEVFETHKALREVLNVLYEARERGALNNNNIPNLVENYFFEMNLVIHELARLLAPGGRVVMVNDNVRYNGEEVPVDLILSDFAARAGLTVERIWVLPRGKGNSSQQMGTYGRTELRKCVYVWVKTGD